MNIKELKEVVDLDIIINNVLDNDNITPEFVKECQKAAMCEVVEYTSKITNKYGMELTDLVEDQAGASYSDGNVKADYEVMQGRKNPKWAI